MLPGVRPGEQTQAAAPASVPAGQPACRARHRPCALRHRAPTAASTKPRPIRTPRCRPARRNTASPSTATVRRAAWRRQRRSGLDFHCHPRSCADYRFDQGPGAAGARRAAARLPDGRRLRRGRGQGRHSRARPTTMRTPIMCRVRCSSAPDFPLDVAAGAHAQRHRADHARPHRASMGRRRSLDDADRARRSRQRRQQRAARVPAAATHVRQAGCARADRAAAQSSRSTPRRSPSC